MGRPTKYNTLRVKRILAALEDGATKIAAAAAGGIHYDTLNSWEKNYSEFSEAVKKAMELGDQYKHDICLERIINDKSWQSAAWYLERTYPERYGVRNNLNVAYEKPMIVVADEETKRLIEKLGDENT